MQAVTNGLGILRRLAQSLGPYLILEILLPGGTLLALALFLWRRGKLSFPAGAAGWNLLQSLLSNVDFGRRQSTT